MADEVWTVRVTGSQTVWDDGGTAWDVSGGVAQTRWDVAAGETWVDQAPGSETWTEQ
jgi:hypothetical protein